MVVACPSTTSFWSTKLLHRMNTVLYITDMRYQEFMEINKSAGVYTRDGIVYSRFGRRISGKNKPGYIVCQLRGGRVETAHRIVWFLTHGEIPDGMVINHIDGDKLNNHPSNLELVTPAGNARHAQETGLMRPLRGDECSWAKLSAEQVREICRLLQETNLQQSKIAEMYGVNSSTISNIKQGKTRLSEATYTRKESRGESSKRAWETGRRKSGQKRGAESPHAKLTAGEVKEIRDMLTQGLTPQKEIAKLYKVSDSVISQIKRGKAYS